MKQSKVQKKTLILLKFEEIIIKKSNSVLYHKIKCQEIDYKNDIIHGMQLSVFFKKIFDRFVRYERHISSAALVFGFVIDNFTLTRIDFWIEEALRVG
mgnify:CR=1 FL=1